MSPEEALKLADAMVSAWLADPPKNSRGYVADGWKIPTISERAEAVEKLAGFLRVPEPEVKPTISFKPPRTTIYGWPTDGSDGPPSKQLYNMAVSVLERFRADNRPYLTAEIDALETLIGAYREANPSLVPPVDPPTDWPQMG